MEKISAAHQKVELDKPIINLSGQICNHWICSGLAHSLKSTDTVAVFPMESRPLLFVKSSAPISAHKAHKSIHSFLKSAQTAPTNAVHDQQSALPDDVLNKLTILAAELDSLKASGHFASEVEKTPAISDSHKKKRKAEVEPESAEKPDKKKKKDKKDKHNKEQIAVPKVVPVVDSKLQGMKNALKKAKSSK